MTDSLNLMLAKVSLYTVWKIVFNFQQRSSHVYAINGTKICTHLECRIFASKNWAKLKHNNFVPDFWKIYSNFINILVVNWNHAIDVTGSQLHDIVWGSIRRLHEIGLNVICVVADGAKPNRRFMKDHSHKEGMKNGIVYKARNIYNPSMFVYFMSDIPPFDEDNKKLLVVFPVWRNTLPLGKN